MEDNVTTAYSLLSLKKNPSPVAEVAVHFIIQIKSHELFLSSGFLLYLMVTHTSSDRFFCAYIFC